MPSITINPRTKDEIRRMYERMADKRRKDQGSPRFTPPEGYEKDEHEHEPL